MAIKASIYNSPDIGAAFSNIAQMFAPPSAQDAAAYATAQALRDKNARLSQLFANPNDPNFDRQNIAVGNYAPTQSFYAQDQNNSTTMRGQDITAATSRGNNAADNQRAVVDTLYGPLSQGQVRPAVPGDVAGMFSLPATPAAQGNPIPLSETQFNAQQDQRLLDEGKLTDEALVNNVMGAHPPVQVVGPDGLPRYSTPGAAAASGAEAYVNKGAAAKPTNATAVLPDGSQVPVVQAPDGTWHNSQTGEKLPDGIRVFDQSKAVGTSEQVGLSKPTNSYIERQLLDAAVAKNTAVTLRDMIAKAPASQGVVGFLRGTAQNVIEAGGEVGSFFGGDVAKAMDEIRKGAADADLAGAFDPKIPAVDMMANLLAFQYAKMSTSGRLSNETFANAKRALGLDGLDGNQKNSVARLNTAIQQISAQEDILRKAQSGGTGALASDPPADVAVSGMNAGDGSDAPEGVDPEDWKYLSDDEKAQYRGQ